MSVNKLSSLLPKNNKPYEPTSTINNRPASQPTSKQKKEPKPRKNNRMTKAQMKRIKQIEADNRAANEAYAKQQRRKRAIISNYVKKKQEDVAAGIIKQTKNTHVVPANLNNSNKVHEVGAAKAHIINTTNERVNNKDTTPLTPKQQLRIDKIINYNRIIMDKNNIEKILQQELLKRKLDNIKIDPQDTPQNIYYKVRFADLDRLKQNQQSALKQRT